MNLFLFSTPEERDEFVNNYFFLYEEINFKIKNQIEFEVVVAKHKTSGKHLLESWLKHRFLDFVFGFHLEFIIRIGWIYSCKTLSSIVALNISST